MSNLSVKRILFVAIVFSIAILAGNSQSFDRPQVSRREKREAHKGPLKTKTAKVKEPKSIEKSKKQQEVKQTKLKKEYNDYVKKNRKHSYDIQSPEVKTRMKKNDRDSKASYSTKHKQSAKRTRKAARKYH